MEFVLSKAGMYLGTVVLTHDAKLLDRNSELFSKLSLNGSKCHKIFKPSMSFTKVAVFLDVCEAEKNTSARSQTNFNCQECWMASPNLWVYFITLTLTPFRRQVTRYVLSSGL